MHIYLATWLEDNQAITLTKLGYQRRLMSYYFLKVEEKEFTKNYVSNGKVEKNGTRKEKEGDNR